MCEKGNEEQDNRRREEKRIRVRKEKEKLLIDAWEKKNERR